MSEMIERVGAAIRSQLHPRLLSEFYVDTNLLARAAIAAMREPTGEMKNAGSETYPKGVPELVTCEKLSKCHRSISEAACREG